MNRTFFLCCVVLSVVGSGAAQQTTGDNQLLTALPLVQVEHLFGDQYVGFTESCLLVYSDGGYRHETRRQEHVDNRPKGLWKLPEVFEGRIDPGEIGQLRQIIETQDFLSLTGSIGDLGQVRSHLAFTHFGVVPHADVDIFEASVAHSKGPQVFEVLGASGSDGRNSLKVFDKWVAAVEKRKEGPLDNGAANSCAVHSSAQTKYLWQPTTRLFPTPSYTPSADCPLPAQAARGPRTVTVHATINPDGGVSSISVTHGVSLAFDHCALDAAEKWKFVPARLAGIPIATPIDLVVSVQPH